MDDKEEEEAGGVVDDKEEEEDFLNDRFFVTAANLAGQVYQPTHCQVKKTANSKRRSSIPQSPASLIRHQQRGTKSIMIKDIPVYYQTILIILPSDYKLSWFIVSVLKVTLSDYKNL